MSEKKRSIFSAENKAHELFERVSIQLIDSFQAASVLVLALVTKEMLLHEFGSGNLWSSIGTFLGLTIVLGVMRDFWVHAIDKLRPGDNRSAIEKVTAKSKINQRANAGDKDYFLE